MFVSESPSSSKPTNTSCISKNTENVQKAFNLEVSVWSKISSTTLETCKKGQKLPSSDRLEIVKKITSYMLNDLKDTTRKTAHNIAAEICNKYPETFSDIIEGKKWSDGITTFRTSIMNGLAYKKSLTGPRAKKVASSDSDDADIEAKKKEDSISRVQDEYGCVEYAPLLPSTENSESQESKRIQLSSLFKNLNYDMSEVQKLMEATYATQRALINDKSKDLTYIITEWPFLTEVPCLFTHATKLLGKDIASTWQNSMDNKIKFLRQYFKMSKNLKKKEAAKEKIIAEYKEAASITQDNFPKILVAFRLLMLHFGEDEKFLYQTIDVSNLLKLILY